MLPDYLAPRVLISRGVILAGLLLCGSALRADIIAGNFATGFGYSFENGIGVADEDTEKSIGIEFMPSGGNYDLTSIEVVATSQDPQQTNSVTMSIFADNGGMPGATALEVLTFNGQLSPLVPNQGDPQASFLTFTSTDNPELDAGTNYWLVMDGPSSESLLWDLNSTGTSGYIRTNGKAGDWVTDPNPDLHETNGVFEVDGDALSGSDSSTPEPQSWWLMAGGVIAMAFFARRNSIAR